MIKNKDELYNLIATALDLDINNLSDDTSTDNTQEWDSLGHLSILTALDKSTKGKSGSIKELSSVNSVKKIVEILQDHDLLN